jgi:hypothetical protein
MKKIILAITLFLAVSGASLMPLTQASAAGTGTNCNQSFLTFPVWYRGLVDSNCNIISPSGQNLSNFIWHIVLNVVEIAMMLVVYLTVFFILYGGFQFLTSMGEADAAAKARTTILNAVIGLVISLVAVAAVNFIVTGLMGNATPSSLTADQVLSGALNSFYFASGIIAVIAIIIAGFMYTTSQGDAGSVSKAKNIILYAVIGLVVIAAAFAVTWFVLGRFA